MLSNNDRLMGILGFFVLIVALIGSTIFEGERPDDDSLLFDVIYTPETGLFFQEGDYTAEGDSWDHALEVNQTNMTQIEFVLTWTDDDTAEANVGGAGVQNQPDSFRLTIILPNGTEIQDEAESDITSEQGIITINAAIFSLPESNMEKMGGSSADEVASKVVKVEGMGVYNITIECINAGDSQTTTGQTTTNDNGNDWNLDVNVYFYTAEVVGSTIPSE